MKTKLKKTISILMISIGGLMMSYNFIGATDFECPPGTIWSEEYQMCVPLILCDITWEGRTVAVCWEDNITYWPTQPPCKWNGSILVSCNTLRHF